MKRLIALGLVLACVGVSVPHASEVQVMTCQGTPSLVNEAADETLGRPQPAAVMGTIRESAVYVIWGTGVTSGVVEVETAHTENYAGTWASLATVTFAGTAPKEDIVQITGIHGALRTRISTVIANGSVSTCILGN